MFICLLFINIFVFKFLSGMSGDLFYWLFWVQNIRKQIVWFLLSKINNGHVAKKVFAYLLLIYKKLIFLKQYGQITVGITIS